MLFYISLWISKLYLYLFKRNSTDDTTGMLACKIDRDFLKHVAKPPTVICVTGTNGKTTTCNFICDFLEKSGFKVAANKEGANLRPGISKALLKTVTIFNQSKADFAVIEFDELSSAELLKDLKPQYVIVTNLSSDTMKRNGHTDYVFARIKAGLNDDMTLILNGDDLISCQLGKDKNAFYFSIKEQPNDKTKTIPFSKDIRLCPVCDSKLIFEVGFLSDEDIATLTKICCEYGISYVKTATGSQAFPDMHQVQIMRANLSGDTKIKVSGVPRTFTLADAMFMFEHLGVSLIGTRSAGKLVDQYAEYLKTL